MGKHNRSELFMNNLLYSRDYYFVKDILRISLGKFKHYRNIKYKLERIGCVFDSRFPSESFCEIKKNKNITIKNNGSILYLNDRSEGCRHCEKDEGCTVRISKKCNRNCFFCFVTNDPIKEEHKYSFNDIKKIITKRNHETQIKSFAISGGEPFLYKEDVFKILSYVDSKYPKLYTRIYTNGDLITENILKELKTLNLDEMRFSIKPFEDPKEELLKLSKRYIPKIIIEMPVFPNTEDYMKKIINNLEAINIDGINLLEFFFNGHNINEFKTRNYKIDLSSGVRNICNSKPIFEYPIYGSKNSIYNLMKYFSDKNLSMFINFCSQKTKQLQYTVRNKRIAKKHSTRITSITKEGNLKVLCIYGELKKILKQLSEKGIEHFNIIDTKHVKRVEINKKNEKYFLDENHSLLIIHKDPTNSFDIDFEIIKIVKKPELTSDVKNILNKYREKIINKK